jgi:hypothetical protein
MKKSVNKHKRKQIFSNPKVQIKIVITFAFLAVLYATANYYIAKGTLWSFSADVLQLDLSETNRDDVNMLLKQQSETLNLQLLLFTALTCIVVTLGGLLMSHRLGGPIYQLRRYLRALTDGSTDPHRIRFRKHDFFHDLADAFNNYQEYQGLVPPEVEAKQEEQD